MPGYPTQTGFDQSALMTDPKFKQQETMSQRIDLARNMEDMVGQYFSKEWFRKNILRQSDEDIETIDSQMEKEKAAGEYEDEGDEDNM